MDTRPPPSLAESIAAAQTWWRDAGVDLAFADDPQAMLAEREETGTAAPEGPATVPRAPPAAPPPLVAIGGDRNTWPRDLGAFAQWWLTEPSLETGGMHPRVPPRGQAGAKLMMLAPMPEEADGNTLLSGSHGKLLASFAQAAGFAAEDLYLAAALPRHNAMPDWADLAARDYGAVLRHHIALAAPERLIVFGRSILPLLGHDPAQATPAVYEMTIQDRHLPMLASYAPERLLGTPRLRTGLWRQWLDWTN
jgi:uracil-DNA glycosylase family 4